MRRSPGQRERKFNLRVHISTILYTEIWRLTGRTIGILVWLWHRVRVIVGQGEVVGKMG